MLEQLKERRAARGINLRVTPERSGKSLRLKMRGRGREKIVAEAAGDEGGGREKRGGEGG